MAVAALFDGGVITCFEGGPGVEKPDRGRDGAGEIWRVS